MDGAGAEEERLAPGGEQGNVGRVREHGRLETGHRLQSDGWHVENVFDGHLPFERHDGAADSGSVADGPEHHFGFGSRRDDVGRDAA